MALRDRMTAQAARAASAAAAKARETVAGSDAVVRLVQIVRIDDDRPMSPERLLVMLVDAVNGGSDRELTDRDVLKAAKRRQRLAGAAGAAGGPVGLQLASLYCEAEIICDVAERHRLVLEDEQLAAHLLVLWNAMPDVASGRAAIDGSGPSVFARMAAGAHAKVVTKPREEMTKRDVVRMLWKLRNVAGDVELPGSSRPRDVLLPGKRVKAFTKAAERQLGVAPD